MLATATNMTANNSGIVNSTLSTQTYDRNFTTYLNASLAPSSNITKPQPFTFPIGLDKTTLISIYAINGTIVLIGTIGNIFVCFVIAKGRRLYTIANVFLMNLAVADTCVLTISYTLWIMKSAHMKWPLGATLCKILPSLSDAFYGVSLGTITTISLYRYRMILFPLASHMTFFQAKVIIFGIWVISLLTISAPLYPVIRYNSHQQKCSSLWPSLRYLRVYQWVMLIMWYVLPLGVILYTYIRIRVHLKHEMKYKWLDSNYKSNDENGCPNNNINLISGHVLGIKRALKLLAPVVIVFTLFMFPWNLGRLLVATGLFRYIKKSHVLEYVGITLLFANSAVNAFIYYFMSREFREECKHRFRIVGNCICFGRIKTFTVQRRYSFSLKTRIELLNVARSQQRKRKSTRVCERVTVL